MSQRLIIQSGASSPIRVSVSGVDAAGAPYNQLLFDGSIRSLRHYQHGFFSGAGSDYTSNANGDFATFVGTVPSAAFGKTFPSPPLAIFIQQSAIDGKGIGPGATWVPNQQHTGPSSATLVGGWTTVSGVYANPGGTAYLVFDQEIV
jgi:hypothetical protein